MQGHIGATAAIHAACFVARALSHSLLPPVQNWFKRVMQFPPVLLKYLPVHIMQLPVHWTGGRMATYKPEGGYAHSGIQLPIL